MSSQLSPFVFWGQTKDFVFLKVQLSECMKPALEISESKINFKGIGVGAQGLSSYGFNVDLNSKIDTKASSWNVTPHCITVKLKKNISDEWVRLTKDANKYPWLKVDFDKLHIDDDDEVDENGFSTQLPPKAFPDEEDSVSMNMDESDFPEVDFKMVYLFFYNLLQFVGFSFIFVKLCVILALEGRDSQTRAFRIVGEQMKFCVGMASLELLNSALRIVRAPLLPTLLQVSGRILILFFLVAEFTSIQTHPVCWFLFFTWTSVELIRYPFYMMTSIKTEWYLLTWLRYSAWIILYPIGFSCEATVMWFALPLLKARPERFSFSLPNSVNASFSFPVFLQLYMLGFLPGAFLLMSHMYRQRKKVISSRAAELKNKKSV